MTCGDGIGNAGGYAKRFCEKKGMEYMGCGKVVMPENYVAMFPVPDRTEAERIIGKAIPQADQIAEHIRKENPLPKAEISLLDRFLSTVVNPVFYKLFVHAGKFRTTERCTGCGGLCKALSPVQYPSGGREPCVGIRLYPLYGLHLPVSGTGHRIRKGQSGKTQIPMSGSRGGK